MTLTEKLNQLIEQNKREIMEREKNQDIMEWYVNQYKGATTK